MCIGHRPALLMLATTAFIAFAASSARAIEVRNEATGVHCATTVELNGGGANEITGGCPVKGASQGHFEISALSGFVDVLCEITLEGRAGRNSHLQGNWALGVGGCEDNSARPCVATDGHPEIHAEATITGLLSSGEASVTADLCTVVGGIGVVECLGVTGQFHQTSHISQRLEFAHANACSNNMARSIQGVIALQVGGAHKAVEVTNS